MSEHTNTETQIIRLRSSKNENLYKRPKSENLTDTMENQVKLLRKPDVN